MRVHSLALLAALAASMAGKAVAQDGPTPLPVDLPSAGKEHNDFIFLPRNPEPVTVAPPAPTTSPKTAATSSGPPKKRPGYLLSPRSGNPTVRDVSTFLKETNIKSVTPVEQFSAPPRGAIVVELPQEGYPIIASHSGRQIKVLGTGVWFTPNTPLAPIDIFRNPNEEAKNYSLDVQSEDILGQTFYYTYEQRLIFNTNTGESIIESRKVYPHRRNDDGTLSPTRNGPVILVYEDLTFPEDPFGLEAELGTALGEPEEPTKTR